MDTETRQLMLGTYSTDGGLVKQYTHWYALCIGNTSPSDLNQDAPPSQSIQVTTFMDLITISDKAYYTGTTTVVITATNIYELQDLHMIPVITCLVGTRINLTCGRFTTRTGLSAPILYFVNRTTVRFSDHSFRIYGCDDKDNSVDAFITSLSLHDYVVLLYHDRISKYHIILSGWCNIANWYCNNLARHLCTTWGTLAHD